jgi:hypothetical protein
MARQWWAAQQLGISFDALIQACRDHGISTSWGLDLADLVRLIPQLIVREKNPERKAQMRAALNTFIAGRDHDQEESAALG